MTGRLTYLWDAENFVYQTEQASTRPRGVRR